MALALLLPLAPGSAGAQQAKLETTYVVLGGEGAIARAVLSDATECPMIEVGGVARRMSIRARPDAAFPVLVCEAPIPPGTASAAIQGRGLPLRQSPHSVTRAAASRLEAISKKAATITTIHWPANSRTVIVPRNGRSHA